MADGNITVDVNVLGAELLQEAAAELLVLRLQRDSLRDALLKVLDTRNREAKATLIYQNAQENFSDSADKRKGHFRAMLAASDAEREARVLLLTLRDGAMMRPPTPAGWSDTDWLQHLGTCPPIGYAVRDNLYGTSRAGVLRFCDIGTPGSFAVYASLRPTQTEPSPATPPQVGPLTEFKRMQIIGDEFPLALVDPLVIAKVDSVCRAIEKAHGIGA
jgi:hypothetical protein